MKSFSPEPTHPRWGRLNIDTYSQICSALITYIGPRGKVEGVTLGLLEAQDPHDVVDFAAMLMEKGHLLNIRAALDDARTLPT